MINPSERRKILVVDDQGLVREGLIRVIGQQKDFELCSALGTMAAAKKAVAQYKPDLVLTDLLLPDGCGLELIKDLVSENPSLLVLVISQCDETLYAERVLRAGACGFVMKNRAIEEIPKAIRAILGGEFYFSPKVAALALHRMAGEKSGGSHENIGSLTDRELQVFQLLGAGTATRDIADRLHLSIKTVETHRENIKHKLKLPSAAELMRYATNWVNSQGSVFAVLPETFKADLREEPSQE